MSKWLTSACLVAGLALLIVVGWFVGRLLVNALFAFIGVGVILIVAFLIWGGIRRQKR